MRSLPAVLLLALAAAPAAATSPVAEVICAPTPEMEARLSAQYGEVKKGLGMRDPEAVMEIWTSPRGSWTLVMAYAAGQSCIVAMGEDWADLAPADPA